MTWPVGGWIGPYQVVDVIGRGGFASVYRCLDDRLGAEVAVKVLADNFALDPEIRERFLHEARLLRRIDDRHLIQVHDVGETERGQPYMVLELADKGDFATRVEQRRSEGLRPGPDDVRMMVETVSRALSTLHENDLVHRDISPSNILIRTTSGSESPATGASFVGPRERLIVSDLGLAKDLAAHSGVTVAGGTARFAAPEQRRPGTIDRRADIYGLARLVEWMLESHDTSAPPWVDRVRTALVPALADDPARRPATATRLASVIEDALPDDGAPIQSETASTRFGMWMRRGVVSLAVVAVLIVATLIWRDETTVEHLDDGRVAVSAQDSGVVVRVTGPPSIEVGASGVFVADVTGGDGMRWVMPDGTEHENVDRVEITGVTPGRATVLVIVEADGEILEVAFDLEVRRNSQ